jgi:hypothetical protein
LAVIVEIDQSGKLEQLDTGTAVAFSNGKAEAIWIPVAVKRSLVLRLRKTLIPSVDLWAVFFAMVIHLLIDRLPPDVVLVIDEEYTGKDKIIAETLSKLLAKKYGNRWRGSIRFSQIGKHSRAHKLSWGIHRMKNRQRMRIIKEEEIFDLLR